MSTQDHKRKDLPKKKLFSILEICKEINAERDLTAFFNLVVQKAAELLEAARASVFILDREKFELWSIVTLDGAEIRFDARLGIAGASITTGEIINIKDAYEDPRFYKKIDGRNNFKTKSVLVVPLISADNQIIGTFQVLNKKSGAFTKQDEIILQHLAQQVQVALETTQMIEELTKRGAEIANENKQLRKEISSQSHLQRIVGNSPPIQSIVRLIEQISDTSINVLITGETGTGKELAAKAIHYGSSRFSGPFIALNCAALPENLIESELFGIEKGVATGVDSRIGKFEQADSGTIFLDEIGDLSLTSQAKILRVLQEGELERIGKKNKINIDVRVLSATNKNLEEEIKLGNFREDLFYRLKVLHIQMPPLREIPADIELLANHFVTKFCKEMSKDEKKISKETLFYLTNYTWPGNVRELENEIKRTVAIVPRKTILPEDISKHILDSKVTSKTKDYSTKTTLKDAVEDLEKDMIVQALNTCRNNKAEAARTLGLSRWGLTKKITRYGLTDL